MNSTGERDYVTTSHPKNVSLGSKEIQFGCHTVTIKVQITFSLLISMQWLY